VCGQVARDLAVDRAWTLRELVDSFAALPEAQLKKPSVRAEGKTLYMQSPASLEAQTRPNLDKALVELGLEDGQEIGVTDPAFATVVFKFRLKFKA
jgi:ubiquitin-activating enzyme E1 C